MTWFAVGGAVVGAVGQYVAAKKANKKKTTTTDQTTVQDPYRADLIGPDIQQILDYQRGIAARGAPRVDARGNVIYDPIPTAGTPGGAAATPVHKTPSGGTGGAGGNTGIRYGGYTPDQLINDPRLKRTLGATALKKFQADQASGKIAGVLPSGGGVGSPTPAPTTPANRLTKPEDIFAEVANRGLAAGNTGTIDQARNVMGNVFGAAGGKGSAATGEQTGFEGYNPILDRLAGTLEGDVNDRAGRDLLFGFLDETNRGGGRSGAAGGASGSTGPGGLPNDGSFNRPINMQAIYNSAYGTPAAQAAQANTGSVPDTVGGQDTFFASQVKQMFDEKANDAELQTLIDAMNADVEKGMFRDMAQLDAAAAGSGRFGGDMWKGLSSDAREQALQEMLKTGAQVRVGDREARRQALLNALGQVNTRDLGLLGANVQREGIAAGERSAANAASTAAGSAADQLALAKRGQDLSAISRLMDSEQFSLGQLGDVGGQLSADRLGALGMVPGLEGIGLSGLSTALGAGGGLTDLRGQDIQQQIANRQANLQGRSLNQQLGMFNAGQGQAAVNDYLRTIMGIGGLGGTSHTTGTNVVPGLGVSTTGAAIQGAVGGAATGAGIYGQGRQAGWW